mgnify:CR=1 FL=1
MFLGVAVDATAQVKTTDSVFINHSRPIEFVVNKTVLSEQDRQWITTTLIPELKALGKRGIVIGRATASPEGPTDNNVRLAKERRASMDTLLSSYGISSDRIRYDVVAEDYPLLHTMMWMQKDVNFPIVDRLMKQHADNNGNLKAALKAYNGGKLWQHILHQYFPKLRAVRIMAIDEKLVEDIPLSEYAKNLGRLFPFQLHFPENTPIHVNVPYSQEEPLVLEEARRELVSVKTNLLYDFAYMPGYDRFCPIPNVAIEYYPLHGHFTYGASFEGPWWQHYQAHKYFQVRNYQLHTRYYLRNGDIRLRHPGEGAAFKGLYFSAYAQAGLYNICFDENRGWEGEGWGAGLGLGYVMPLGKTEHWRLEFGLQAGFLQTDYDPYQWLCPIDPVTDKQQYYYKWYGDAKDFKKRQHRYTWLGPTRIEITLSYDLLYRRNHKKGASFKNYEFVTNPKRLNKR